MNAYAPLPKDDPRMVAWEAFKSSADYNNIAHWAARPPHTDGSLWAAFIAGWTAALAPAAPREPDEGEPMDVAPLLALPAKWRREAARMEGSGQADALLSCAGDLEDAWGHALTTPPAPTQPSVLAPGCRCLPGHYPAEDCPVHPAPTQREGEGERCLACGGSGIAVNPSGGDVGGCTDCLGTGREA